MKKFLVLLAAALIGLLAWTAAGPDKTADVPVRVPPAMGGAPPLAGPPAANTSTASAPDLSGEPLDSPPLDSPSQSASWPAQSALSPPSASSPPRSASSPARSASSTEPEVPPEIIAPIATATAPPPLAATDTIPSMRDADGPRAMIVPVAGIARSALRDMFNEVRGSRRHEAIDILAPRGTPVIATDDGVVKKLFTSKPGGLTVYQFDPDQRFCYYYAHLDRYAPGLHEGQILRSGDVLGYVGTTGNAPKDTPHLHFALIRLDFERRWWKGTYVNPYPPLTGR